MATAKDHYDKHLARVYGWMIGDLEVLVSEQKAFFQRMSLGGSATSLACDLGCGNGVHSLALAQLGYQVTAIDFSHQLLKELEEQKGNLPIVCIENDIISFLDELRPSANVITCMGDTITHLPSEAEVQALLMRAAACLLPGGHFIISWRDLTVPLHNESRFIPVRSDNNRIHTCFLEFHEAHVQVFDLLYEKKEDQWQQSVSSYTKLKLAANQMEQWMANVGMRVKHREVLKRMNYLVATI